MIRNSRLSCPSHSPRRDLDTHRHFTAKVNPPALALPQDPRLKGLPVVCASPNYSFLLSKLALGDSSGAASCQSWPGHSVLFLHQCIFQPDRGRKLNGSGPLHKVPTCMVWMPPKREHTLGGLQVFFYGEERVGEGFEKRDERVRTCARLCLTGAGNV